MNYQFEVKCQTLWTTEHSIMVHERVLDEYIPFALMYTTDNIFFYSTKQIIGKPGWWTNYDKQNSNWYENLSIKPTCFIFSMCCTKGNLICWYKGVKYTSSASRGFLGYLLWNYTTSKGLPHLFIWCTENSFFTWRVIWKNIFQCVCIRVMSVFICTCYATSNLVYSVRYIISWKNSRYYNFCTVWKWEFSQKQTYCSRRWINLGFNWWVIYRWWLWWRTYKYKRFWGHLGWKILTSRH